MLRLIDVHSGYEAIEVLRGISLDVFPGEIVTLIGCNGAGKTTVLNTICGIVQPTAGTITFDGTDITELPSPQTAARGLAHVPEGRKLFGDMTVRENLELGAFLRRDRDGIRRDIELMVEMFPILGTRAKTRAGSLSGGEQQMCAIARGLMAQPKLLMLDEPSLGLSPKLVGQIFEIIKSINAKGTTILLVEQNANLALQIAHRGYVLTNGSITLSGRGSDLLGNDEVRKQYLGES